MCSSSSAPSAPASPSDPLKAIAFFAAEQLLTKKKSVCFDPSVKLHDGITQSNFIFDKLVTSYIVGQNHISELDVLELTGPNVEKIYQLHNDIADLAERIEDQGCAPVLPGGGGLAIKLSEVHVPYLRVLGRVVEASASRLLLAKEQHKQRRSSA